MSSYQQFARQTYGAFTTIIGDGQWALERPRGGIELFPLEENARERQAALGGRVMRLMPKRLELTLGWDD